MAGDPKNPVIGEYTIDASEIEPFAVDILSAQGLRTEHEGVDTVIWEVSGSPPDVSEMAGISPADVKDLLMHTQRMKQCDKFIQALQRLVKRISGTRAVESNARELLINSLAEGVERRAKLRGNDALLAQYGNLRKYRSAAAVKAAKTRRRNQKKAEAVDAATPEASSSEAEQANGAAGESNTRH